MPSEYLYVTHDCSIYPITYRLHYRCKPNVICVYLMQVVRGILFLFCCTSVVQQHIPYQIIVASKWQSRLFKEILWIYYGWVRVCKLLELLRDTHIWQTRPRWCYNNTHYKLAHNDVMKWKHFPRYWPFVQEIPHTKARDAGLWCFFYLRLNKHLSKQSRGYLKRHRAHYDVSVMTYKTLSWVAGLKKVIF